MTRPTVTAFLLLMFVTSHVASAASMQVAPPAEAVAVTVETSTGIDFPQGMTFSATIPLPDSAAEVDTVQLLYRIASDPTLNLEIVPPGDVVVDNNGAHIETFVDFLSGFLPVGVELTFSWEILLADSTVVSTADETAHWMDDRFDWVERTSDQVRLYTYETDDAFADMMLSESQATIDALESTYVLDAIPPVSIWVYPSYEDFSGTRQGNQREAVAGVSYPGMDTMIVVVPDGDEREFGRVVPHEISHQVLFAATRNAYGPPPVWFDEGMATHTQIGGTDGYAGMVARAEQEGVLFDIQSLSESFPFGPAQATLAYASSWSMISYIEERWGPEGITRMIDAFAEGMPVDEAIPAALDVSLDELNVAWKAWVSIGD